MLDASQLEIVTLSENTAHGRGILGEWGLSMLVKAGKRHLLLDAGAGLSAAHDLALLGFQPVVYETEPVGNPDQVRFLQEQTPAMI